MNKEQFLKRLRASLKRFDAEEVAAAVGYYEEIINDEAEHGRPESEIIARLGDIKDITKEMRLDILAARASKPSTLKRSAASAWVALALLASPALFPVSIALFAVFFTVIVTSGALLVSFFAAAVGIMISVIPAIVYMAHAGAGATLLAVGGLLVAAAVCGFLAIVFYKLTKIIINGIARFAAKLARREKVYR